MGRGPTRLATCLAERFGNDPLAYVLVDVFAEAPLQGNQLAVFTGGGRLSAEQMQRLALEVNFSETVFVLRPEQDGDARLRIFTPRLELPFAGHPVLGTALVVAVALGQPLVRLETGVGEIPVDLQPPPPSVPDAGTSGEGLRGFGRMLQAIPAWRPYERDAELLAALGVEGSGLPVEAYENGPLHVYVELPDEDVVAALSPDMGALAALGDVCANCFSGSGGRWKTRMFAPGGGVPEDPATGSAAGPLALHLSRHGRIAFGEEIEIRQGEELGRPSLLRARAEGSPERVERIEVGGSAVIVAEGRFLSASLGP